MAAPDAPVRSPAAAVGPPLRVRFDRFQLDEANARLLRDGKGVDLPPMPFAVLCALAREPGALRTKNALLDEVWGHRFVSESVLKTVIRNLRVALGDDARQPRFIETVSRRGYRFIAPIAPADGPAAAAVPAATAPASFQDPEGTTFTGREAALKRLRGGWARALAGRRTIVWVAGEPGIGKSTLAEHFTAGLADAMCIRGQCVEQHGAGEPYLPVLEALADLCRRDAEAIALLRDVAPTWLVQLPWLSSVEERESLRRELAGVSPERMLRELGELLDRYCERRPLLLLTEDLHWSDRATIQLIDHVARRRSPARLLWLATFRVAEVVATEHSLNRLRRELRLHGICEEILLDPFSEHEVAEYLRRAAPSMAGDEDLVRALHAKTDGLPLFVAQLAADVLATGDGPAETPASRRIPTLAIPENISGMIDHRIERLEAHERVLLAAAAVCGVEFRVATAAGALGVDGATVRERCEALLAGQVWLAPALDAEGAPASFRFRHALLRQVLYDRTPRSERVELHRRVAAALEGERAAGTPVAAAELAVHVDRGGDPLRALRYHAESAQEALLHYSPEQCLSIVDDAIALLDNAPAGPERDEVEVSLAAFRGVAASQLAGMGSTQAKEGFERAAQLLDLAPGHPLRALLLHGYGVTLAMRAEFEAATEVARKARSMAGDSQDAALALAASTIEADVHMLRGEPAEACRALERALPAAAQFDHASTFAFVADPEVSVLSLLGLQLLHLGRPRESRARLDEAHARAGRIAQPMAKVIAMWLDGLCDVRLGNVARVAALADAMHNLVEEYALMDGRNASRWLRGWARARMGDPVGGERLIREACDEAARLGMCAGATENLGYTAEALILAGEPEKARRQLDQALAMAASTGERVYLPQLLIAQAALARVAGDSEAADAALGRALAEARTQRSPWLELVVLVESCEHGGQRAAHKGVLAKLLPSLGEARESPVFQRAEALLR